MNFLKKTIQIILAFLIMVFCIVPYNSAFGADGEVVTTELLGTSRNKGTLVVKVTWTAAAGGTKANFVFRTSTSCTGSMSCSEIMDSLTGQGYYLYAVRTIPGTTAPAANYDITIIDTESVDIMGGKLANRSATAAEYVTAPGSPQPIYDDLTITWANVTNANCTGTVYLLFALYPN